MRLHDLSRPDFLEGMLPELSSYQRVSSHMPPLDRTKMTVRLLLGAERLGLRSTVGGDGSFVLFYKGKEGALTCVEEQLDGEQLEVVQSNGASSKVAYRVSTSFDAQRFFGGLIRRVVEHPETAVRRVVMPVYHDLGNIEGVQAHRTEGVMQAYARFRSALGMVFSREENAYIFEAHQQRVVREP